MLVSKFGAAYSVSRKAVRRFLLETQHLSPDQQVTSETEISLPDKVLHMIRDLECVQIDPVAAVERNQHLVLAARIPDYKPQALNQLLQEGAVFEYFANAACVIPMADYPLFEPVRQRIQSRLQPEMDKIKPVVQHVLERLEVEGPLASRAFESTERVHGYWDNKLPKTKATSLALNLLMDAGLTRVVHREGNERFFALATHSVPEHLLQQANEIDETAAREAMTEKYMRAYRVFDYRDIRFGWQKLNAAERKQVIMDRVQAGNVIPLQIEGVKTEYFMLSSDLDRLQEHERSVQEESSIISKKRSDAIAEPVLDTTNLERHVRFLPPLDNLLWRRERLEDLFGFTYRWEIYTPAVKRRYGYYAMPILAGDQLIGRIDPRMNREQNHLYIQLLQLEPDVKVTSGLRQHIREAIEAFAQFHGAREYTVERTEPDNIRI